MAKVTLAEIEQARARIAGHVLRTPTLPSPSLTARLGVPVHLKLEQRQTTGAFKLRGATNALLAMDEALRRRGVVTASTGNHGRALAHAAKATGTRCIVCMSGLVRANKVDAVKALGAEIRIVGTSQDDAQVEVDRLVAADGLVEVPPFDDPAIIAGQGTIGLEMVEDVPDVATVLVSLSGGGLASGIAAAVKGKKPDVRLIGVSMELGAAMAASLEAGRPVMVEERPTLADSLGGGIGMTNRWTFAMVRDLIDEVALVSEAEIADGIRHAYAEEREIVEGGAAVGIAALLAGKVRPDGPTIALVSGRNIDMTLHRQLICGGIG